MYLFFLEDASIRRCCYLPLFFISNVIVSLSLFVEI